MRKDAPRPDWTQEPCLKEDALLHKRRRSRLMTSPEDGKKKTVITVIKDSLGEPPAELLRGGPVSR